MDKNKLATAVIGGVGLCYTAAITANPDTKKDCEEYVENAAEAIGNIPLTVTEDFDLVTESGDHIITQGGDRIIVREKVTYGIDLRGQSEVVIVSSVGRS